VFLVFDVCCTDTAVVNIIATCRLYDVNRSGWFWVRDCPEQDLMIKEYEEDG